MVTTRRIFRQSTLALVYDFDGTLTPLPMQEYTILPKLGISGQRFWKDVIEEAAKTKGDHMLTYLRLLVERIEENHQHLTRSDLRALAKDIEYFPGVERWFQRTTEYVRKLSGGKVKLLHYVISAGLREILEGVSIKSHFSRIYASEYYFNHHGVATFPQVVITDTQKTQFLFRINKGKEDVSDSINEYMPEGKRPIPFQNILYLGDGLTDVPSMTVTRKNGGHAIAVHKPRTSKSIAVCKQLLKAGRVDFFAPADYRKGKILESQVRTVLDLMVKRVMYDKAVFDCSGRA